MNKAPLIALMCSLCLCACTLLPITADQDTLVSDEHSTIEDMASNRDQESSEFWQHGQGKQQPEPTTNTQQPEMASDPWSQWHQTRQILDFPNDRVEAHIQHYAHQTGLFSQLQERGELYLPYIQQQISKRGLPSELLMLPIIESNLDPFAFSQGRAAGIWQFIPSTGRHFGLEQDWWYDGRRDIIAATQVALDYLEQHYRTFNDWPLAIAAYNGGAGTILRAQQRNREQGLDDDYWSLQLNRETREYVGKIIAMSELMSYPEQHNIALPELSKEPSFVEVYTGGQIDLGLIANLLQLELDQLYRLNPGLNRWSTPPLGPHRLLVPKEHEDKVVEFLGSLPQKERIQWQRHIVVAGDTLGGIAQQYNSTIDIIKTSNNLEGNLIRIGQELLIPGSSALSIHQPNPQDQASTATHQVRAGESLWTIARQHGVTVAQLTQWNNLNSNAVLRIGQELQIFASSSSNQQPQGPREVITRTVFYQVRPGDTLSSISSRFNVSSQHIRQRNNINQLRTGQQLVMDVPINPY